MSCCLMKFGAAFFNHTIETASGFTFKQFRDAYILFSSVGALPGGERSTTDTVAASNTLTNGQRGVRVTGGRNGATNGMRISILMATA